VERETKVPPKIAAVCQRSINEAQRTFAAGTKPLLSCTVSDPATPLEGGSHVAAKRACDSQLVRGICPGEVPAVLDALDPEVEWRLGDNWIYADRSPLMGPQAIVEGTFKSLRQEWEGFSVIPDALLDAGDHVVALGIYRGTHKTTRKQVRAQFAHIWTLARGKVHKLQHYTDTKQFAKAVIGAHP
jgi:ketosteroid isomerase-like protein